MGLLSALRQGSAGRLWVQAQSYLVARRKSARINDSTTQTISEEHQRFLAASEGSMDAFYILDSVRDQSGVVVDFTFRYLNPHAESRFNCRREDLLGTSYRKRMEMVLEDHQFNSYCEVVATGSPLCVEFPVKKPGARITWLRHQVVKLGDGIAVTSNDLSEFKSVQNRFHEVAEFSEMIFDNAPFSIIATDATGTITAMNLEAETLTGYRSADLTGSASLLLLHDSDELEQRAAHIHEEHGVRVRGFDVIAGPAAGWKHEAGGTAEPVHQEQWTFVRRDGTRVEVSLAVKVLRGPDGTRTGLIGIASDATRRVLPPSHPSVTNNYDALTGLIGFSLLEDRITQAIKRSKRVATKLAVFTIDLDHFKRINDSLGHRVGDEILMIAAARLMEKVRSADTVARVGGDEFIVLISDQLKVSDIEFCAELFLRAISAPYHVDGHTINVTATVGICLYPDFASDTEQMLRRSEGGDVCRKGGGSQSLRALRSGHARRRIIPPVNGGRIAPGHGQR